MKKLIFMMLILFGFFSVSKATEFQEEAVFEFDNGVKLHLEARMLVLSEHKISYWAAEDEPFDICMIDDEPAFGSFLEAPKSVLESAYIEIENEKIDLDVSHMYNPWVLKPDKKDFIVERSGKGKMIRVTGFLSDGAYSYVVQWRIFDNVSIRTVLSNDEDVAFLLGGEDMCELCSSK